MSIPNPGFMSWQASQNARRANMQAAEGLRRHLAVKRKKQEAEQLQWLAPPRGPAPPTTMGSLNLRLPTSITGPAARTDQHDLAIRRQRWRTYFEDRFPTLMTRWRRPPKWPSPPR